MLFSKLAPPVWPKAWSAASQSPRGRSWHEKKSGIRANGWSFTLKTGAYGLEYLQRAYITAMDLGANRPQDMVFPMARWDENAGPLDGANDMCCLSPGENSSGHGVLVADNVQL